MGTVVLLPPPLASEGAKEWLKCYFILYFANKKMLKTCFYFKYMLRHIYHEQFFVKNVFVISFYRNYVYTNIFFPAFQSQFMQTFTANSMAISYLASIVIGVYKYIFMWPTNIARLHALVIWGYLSVWRCP